MTNTIDITPVIEIVITLLGTVVTVMVIPWLKSRLDTNQWQALQDWAKVGVNAAEVLFKGTKLGKDKLAYVTKYLNEMCEKYNYHFDETTIRQAIESAWKDMTDGELKPIEYKSEISE